MELAQPAAETFPEPVKEAAVSECPAASASALSTKKERVDTSPLEGIRALACAVIAANHWLLWYGKKKHGAIELQGGFAVTVFFFITGFVMYLAYGEKACREDFKYWDFIKRRYIRLVPVHWLCIATYAPVIAYNYDAIANDYYFWQNASGEKHLWVGWLLNPLFLSSWIFAPLHYWNSVAWSVSTQMGFYFAFPFVARFMKRRLAREEGGLAVAAHASGAAVETEEEVIEARYRRRARFLYALSVLVPFAAMVFLNNPRFREYWSSPSANLDPETGKETVTELGSDVDGIRAYFLARSWPPFRAPVFLLGALFGARRDRARRNATDKDETVIRSWAALVDRYAFRLAVFWTFAAAFSLAYSESKPVRLFSEFFLLYPAALVVFGLTVAGDASRAYRFLTHPVLKLGGRVSYAAYLLQFPLWTYIDRMAYGTFENRFPPCSRHDPDAAASWTDCFAQSGYQEWPDVMVVWNVFLLFAVAYVVNRYYETKAVAFLARRLLRDKTNGAPSASKRAPETNAADAERVGAR